MPSLYNHVYSIIYKDETNRLQVGRSRPSVLSSIIGRM